MIPLEAKLIAAAVVLVGLAVGIGLWQHHERQIGAAQCRAETAAAVNKALQEAAAETNRLIQAAKDQDHEDLAKAELRADNSARAADAAERLRQRFAAIAASCNPAASSVGPAASAPGDLLAYVQRRMGEAAAGVVRYADQAGNASESCAKRYDSLTK